MDYILTMFGKSLRNIPLYCYESLSLKRPIELVLYFSGHHCNGNVILTKLCTLAVPDVGVITTYSYAAIENSFAKWLYLLQRSIWLLHFSTCFTDCIRVSRIIQKCMNSYTEKIMSQEFNCYDTFRMKLSIDIKINFQIFIFALPLSDDCH